eukprot:TRINITY_DN703_c0_g6_i1.p2 TRINITY_DN703_c0_g6~~TRINITY_DN703_c0_g6_i1.p2  ORF type:complete len:192 (-),score=13.52 TRINITY_DN703_c0_g6_i1:131-706(-)
MKNARASVISCEANKNIEDVPLRLGFDSVIANGAASKSIMPVRAFKFNGDILKNVDNTIAMMRQRVHNRNESRYTARSQKCSSDNSPANSKANTSPTKDTIVSERAENVDELIKRRKSTLNGTTSRQLFAQRSNSEILLAGGKGCADRLGSGKKHGGSNIERGIRCENCLLLLVKGLSSAGCRCHRLLDLL